MLIAAGCGVYGTGNYPVPAKANAFVPAIFFYNTKTTLMMATPNTTHDPISTLEEAIRATREFKEKVKTGNLPIGQLVKGYFLHRETILHLLGQNEGATTGLKIYFALRGDEKDKQWLDLVVVPTYSENGDEATDFGIPKADEPSQVTRGLESFQLESGGTAVFGAPRPCPSQCGSINPLNND